MSKYLSLGLLMTAMVSFPSAAEVKLTTDREVELLVVNGQEYTGQLFGDDTMILPDGVNQLLVKVVALVQENGRRNKFDSHSQVVLLNASDTQLHLSLPVKLKTGDDADMYNRSPQLQLTENGQAYPFKHDVIVRNGFELFYDHTKDIAAYNQAGGIAAMKATKADAEYNNTEVDLKAYFMALPLEQRKDFVSWAVQHLNE